MRMLWMSAIVLFVAAVAGLSQPGLAQQKPSVDPAVLPYAPVNELAGRLTIAGSETMQPLLIRMGAEFRRRYPEVKIVVEGGGSAAAIVDFIEGSAMTRRGDGNVLGHEGSNQVHIMASSRELSSEEVRRFFSRYGYPPTAIPIAVDAVAVYVHRNNPVLGLTLDQVDAIFSKTRKRGLSNRIDRWGQLRLGDEWGQAEIRVYGRDRNSATRAFFQEHVLQHGEFAPSVMEEPGQASLMLAVSRDRFGIGYGGIGYLATTVRTVPLAEREGLSYVAPSIATAADGTYPLRRLLYLYINKSPGGLLQRVVQEFLAFGNSREGQATVIKSGFYPLGASQVERNLAVVTAIKSP
jgi:phosphate transport system substrate-binding protein